MNAPSLLYSTVTIGCLYIVICLYFVGLTDFVPLLKTAKRIVWNEKNADEFSPENADLFDYCPFDDPDPWHESIAQYVDVKYGFETKCPSKDALEPITKVDNGKVILKKGYEKFKCKARCLHYLSDRKYNASRWQKIEKTKFQCDFVETECRGQNTTKRFIHMRIEERRSSNNSIALKREKNPDVHVIVIDSVASTHFIRALPRTTNFLMSGMDAVAFRKLNKVGYNSRPNGFAALLGKSTEPVVRTLMKLKTIEPDMNHKDLCSKYIDESIFIPMEYKRAGYKTFDAEDFVTSFLRYPNCRGLEHDTLDHYYRTFYARLRGDKELSNIHEQGRCRGSVDNILEFLEHYVNSYKVETIV